MAILFNCGSKFIFLYDFRIRAGSYTNITVTQGGCTSNSLSQVLADPGAAIIIRIVTQVSSCGALMELLLFRINNRTFLYFKLY
jgi:hypothetical protein